MAYLHSKWFTQIWRSSLARILSINLLIYTRQLALYATCLYGSLQLSCFRLSVQWVQICFKVWCFQSGHLSYVGLKNIWSEILLTFAKSETSLPMFLSPLRSARYFYLNNCCSLNISIFSITNCFAFCVIKKLNLLT